MTLPHPTEAPTLFPATAAQDRMWRMARDHGDLLSKNIAVQWELQGRFSDAHVEAAFQAVIDRHEVLRSFLVERDDGLWQQVVPELPFRLGLIDLRTMAPDLCEARIRDIAVELAGQPFDMGAPGQLRACLVRLAPDRARLLIATHYGVFDGYSIRVLGREIGTLIGAAETGTAPDLPELALQYGDYAAWRAACEPTLTEARDHWHARLKDRPWFQVPTDRPRQPGRTRQGATLKLPMEPDFRAELERAAKAQGTSPFAFGAGVMAATLHAVTGEERVGFTTCVAGRDEVELETLIGCFVNPVVLCFDCGGATLGQTIADARRIVAEALAHGDYPFDRLAQELNQPMDPSRTPFVAPFFSLQSVFVEEQSYGPLRIVSVPSHTPEVTHDLAVQVIGRASGWHMVIDYDTGLYDEATVQAFARTLQETFTAAFQRPESRISPVAAKTAPPVSAPAAGAAGLALLWAETLGQPPSGPAADFFAEGGTSIGLLRLLSRIEAEMGARIAISDVFLDPTFAGLSRRIGVARDLPAEDAMWQVIPLRAGVAATAPLVVSLNQPFLYHGLARSLPAEVRVVNLNIRSLSALNGTDAEVLEAVIDRAARAIAAEGAPRVQLIGHCVDGVLALLVARRLADRGAAPELVTMIDAWAPGAQAGLSPLRRKARRWGGRLRRWRLHLSERLAGRISWSEYLARHKLTRPLMVALGHVAPETEAERQAWAINARLVALVRGIEPPAYTAPVVLFATAGQGGDARPRLFGWTGRLAADTPVFDLPGWHEISLRTVGVTGISAVLSARLAR